MAEAYLVKQSLKLQARNFRSRFGEIDLIFCERNTLIFVEVRFRSNTSFGSAIETVNIHKQRKLIKTAQAFLAAHPQYSRYSMRFDIVGIDADQQISWLKGAFLSN